MPITLATVIATIETVILHKKAYAETLKHKAEEGDRDAQKAVQYIAINVEELQAILDDLKAIQ